MNVNAFICFCRVIKMTCLLKFAIDRQTIVEKLDGLRVTLWETALACSKRCLSAFRQCLEESEKEKLPVWKQDGCVNSLQVPLETPPQCLESSVVSSVVKDGRNADCVQDQSTPKTRSKKIAEMNSEQAVAHFKRAKNKWEHFCYDYLSKGRGSLAVLAFVFLCTLPKGSAAMAVAGMDHHRNTSYHHDFISSVTEHPPYHTIGQYYYDLVSHFFGLFFDMSVSAEFRWACIVGLVLVLILKFPFRKINRLLQRHIERLGHRYRPDTRDIHSQAAQEGPTKQPSEQEGVGEVDTYQSLFDPPPPLEASQPSVKESFTKNERRKRREANKFKSHFPSQMVYPDRYEIITCDPPKDCGNISKEREVSWDDTEVTGSLSPNAPTQETAGEYSAVIVGVGISEPFDLEKYNTSPAANVIIPHVFADIEHPSLSKPSASPSSYSNVYGVSTGLTMKTFNCVAEAPWTPTEVCCAASSGVWDVGAANHVVGQSDQPSHYNTYTYTVPFNKLAGE